MSGSFTVNGSNTVVDFSYTAPTQTVIDVVTAAANSVYDGSLGDFSLLTNQQKLNVLDTYIKNTVVNMYRQFTINSAVATTRSTTKASVQSVTIT